jgi:argininosuccinate lyase
MRRAAAEGFSNATDLADYLVGRGLAFRDAHQVTGVLVRQCAAQGRQLEDLALEEMALALPAAAREQGIDGESFIGGGVYEALKLENVVAARNTYGGTAPAQVRAAIARARGWLAEKGFDRP